MDTGKIVRFDNERGFGFIRPDVDGDDLFVHTNDLCFDKSEARLGATVRFRAEEGDRGAKAVEVKLLEVRPALGFVNGTAISDDEAICLDEQDYVNEVTEILIESAPSLTGAQIIAIRQALLREATHHGWVEMQE